VGKELLRTFVGGVENPCRVVGQVQVAVLVEVELAVRLVPDQGNGVIGVLIAEYQRAAKNALLAQLRLIQERHVRGVESPIHSPQIIGDNLLLQHHFAWDNMLVAARVHYPLTCRDMHGQSDQQPSKEEASEHPGGSASHRHGPMLPKSTCFGQHHFAEAAPPGASQFLKESEYADTEVNRNGLRAFLCHEQSQRADVQ